MTIKIDDQLQDMLNALGTIVEKNRPDQTKIRRRYKGDGSKIKLYAKRSPNSRKDYYHQDGATKERLDWISNVIETVLGLRVSSSIIVRRAMLAYQLEIIDLLMNFKSADPACFNDYLDNIEKERALLYEAANTLVDHVKVFLKKKKKNKKNDKKNLH